MPAVGFETAAVSLPWSRAARSLAMLPPSHGPAAASGETVLADITGRKSSEDAIRESEERFRLVADTAPVLIWMSDADKLCTYFNQPWLEFTGESLESQLGNGWTNGVHPEDLKRCLRIYTEAFDRRERFRMEYRLRRRDGEYRWILDNGVPRFDPYRSFAGYIGSCIDVTERKQAEEDLLSMTRRVIEAQEQERARIARELHDDIGQRVSLLAINLAQLQQSHLKSVEFQDRIGELQEETCEIATDIHTLSHHLHSARLEYLGIDVVMRGFCQEFGKQTKVRINFRSQDLPGPVPPDISLCLFRVLQESLHNSAKHSGAQHVEVELRGTPDEIHLVVSDSGSGFDSEGAKQSGGLGLISMEERLRVLKGTFSIESQAKRGTKIHARVPLVSGSDSMQATG
jgi:PAS domain S-box-containing protein